MLEADQAARVTRHEARRLDLLVALSVSDLRARYGRGSWKSLKWLLDPFFATGVYLILVTFVIDRPGEAPGALDRVRDGAVPARDRERRERPRLGAAAPFDRAQHPRSTAP